jgi:pimeloyl-ACP methyl ester carboxylesterase
MNATRRLITLDQGVLYTECFGDLRDPCVLLIMGAMASGAWWPDAFCEGLAERGRCVIRYDHRDTGASVSYEPGTAPYAVEDLADDIVRVLDCYSMETAHLVGMSLGGYLAQLVALKHPRRVLTLTAIASEPLSSADPSIAEIDPALLEYHAAAATLDWTDREAVLAYQVGAWRLLAGSAHPFDEELIRTMAASDFDRTPNPLSAFNHATLGEAVGWIDRLDELRLPCLVIHGTEDRVLPVQHARRMHEALADSRLVLLEGSGHELARPDWPRLLDEIERHTTTTKERLP